MTEKTAAEKMRIKPGTTIALLHTPEGFAELLGLPEGVRVASGADGADTVIAFAGTQAEVEERLPAMLKAATAKTALWVVYPKGSKAAGLDVSRDTIWPFAESLGMRPVGMVSVDGRWSGFRLKPPA